MRKIILFAAWLLFAGGAHAATYHVSTTGNDDTGDGSEGSPWLTPVFGASQLTSSGDILIIHTGTYDITTSSTAQVAAIYPRAANCTIRSATGESVTLRGNSGTAPTNGVIGNFNGSAYNGLTIDGFTIQGLVSLVGGSSLTVKNCDISIGGDTWSGWGFGHVIWINNCNGALIQNCKLHDNSSSGLNAPLIMEYTSYNITIEYCDIYNSTGMGIRFKDDPNSVTVRYCHIYGNAMAGVAGPSQSQGYDMYIHNNIIRNNNSGNDNEQGGIRVNVYIDRSYIYNNTLYANGFADLVILNGAAGGVDNVNFYNNISHSPNSTHIALQYTVTTDVLDYSDYNCFYNDLNYELTNSVLTSLASWQSSASRDANSVITDPGFLNASGNWNLPSDFKRSSYTANGRGGEYASVMGAYITGSETIGYTAEGGDPDPDTTPPTVTISTSDPQGVSTSSVSISWTDSDDTAVTSRKWCIGAAPDATHGTECTSPATVTGLSVGSNTVYIGAGDAAGNWGSDSITVNYSPVASSTIIINSGIRGGGGVR